MESDLVPIFLTDAKQHTKCTNNRYCRLGYNRPGGIYEEKEEDTFMLKQFFRVLQLIGGKSF